MSHKYTVVMTRIYNDSAFADEDEIAYEGPSLFRAFLAFIWNCGQMRNVTIKYTRN